MITGATVTPMHNETIIAGAAITPMINVTVVGQHTLIVALLCDNIKV